MIPCLVLSLALACPELVNPSFEASDALDGWRTWIYTEGPAPTVRADDAIAHGGGRSLLVESAAPADIAVGQTVGLPPGSIWRARCWIRSENLTAVDPTDVGAALHVQTEDGALLARSDSRFGTTDWRDAQAVFRVPANGRAKIVLFFVGYGKGAGRVWFDDVRLEQVSAGQGPQTMLISLKKGPAPIDVKQGGQFIEPLCNLIPSMAAQQVVAGSFEEQRPWNFAYRPAVDRPYRPWYPSGAVHVAEYEFDAVKPFNGARSQRIALPVGGARAGLSQDGFYAKPGVGYRLSLHARSEGDVKVNAVLHAGGKVVAGPVELGVAPADWTKLTGVLKATAASENATLSIEFVGPGTLWLDRVYLIGDDAVNGIWRPDVVEAIRKLNPGVLRFGGSAMLAFEWEQCIGDWDTRAPLPIPYWGGAEDNFVGIEEFIQLCEHLDVEPLICARWTGKTPADAAAQVEYFNGGPDTPMGARRAANGRREPYGVRYWQIGNEVSGDAYNASVKDFAAAMRKADPSIKLIASSTHPDMLRFGGGELDYICDHHYGCNDVGRMEACFEDLRAQIERSSGRPVRVAVTEWNTTAADWGLKRAAMLTLGNALACARYHNILQRNADIMEIGVRSNLCDSFCSGIIQPGPGWLYLTPTYYAQELYARAAGSYPVAVRSKDDLSPTMLEPDVSATVSEDGRLLRIYAVNSSPQTQETTFEFVDGAARIVGGAAHVIQDRDQSGTTEVLNDPADPQRVVTQTSTLTAPSGVFRYAFEPLSVTLLELELDAGASGAH